MALRMEERRTWHMNWEMTRWNAEPLKWSGLPEGPTPFSPVHSARKFCERGTLWSGVAR